MCRSSDGDCRHRRCCQGRYRVSSDGDVALSDRDTAASVLDTLLRRARAELARLA